MEIILLTFYPRIILIYTENDEFYDKDAASSGQLSIDNRTTGEMAL